MVHGAPMLVVVPSSLHFLSAGSHTMFGHRVLQATLLLIQTLAILRQALLLLLDQLLLTLL